MKRLAMVILNWNCAADSITCIESLLSQLNTTDDKIVIVDNNSSDNSVKVLRDFASQNQAISLIENKVNSGFAGGINTGIRWAMDNDFEFIGLLNPDATASKGWVSQLLRVFDSNDVGIATGLLLQKDSKHIDSAGDFYTTWGLPGPRLRNQPSERAPQGNELIFGATGGAVIYRTKVFEKIGLFDEKFFLYYEDVDISFRAQLAGFKVIYIPSAIAYHDQGTSTRKVPGLAVYHTFKNLPMLFTKNVPLSLCWRMYPRFVLMYFLILGKALVSGRAWPATKGFLMSWTLIPHMFSERWRTQKSRVVSDEYINSIILQDIPEDQTGLRKFRDMFMGKKS